MPLSKRNEFLDASESEDDHREGGHDSEVEIIKGRQSTKRRKLEHQSDSESEGSDVDGANCKDGDAEEESDQEEEEVMEAQNIQGESAKPAKPQLKLNITNPAARKNLITTDKAIKRSGVIYLSRIPPFMKVAKVRSLLEPFGTINRIFLSPEDAAARSRRVRAGGNKKKTFTEGWVEFVRKKDAKRAAELLNAHPIGGRKGSWYADDVWAMLYLKGFKWRDLTGQIAAEEAERASRMRAELLRASKSDKAFARNVDMARQVEGMEKKRKERHPKPGHGNQGEDDENANGGQDTRTQPARRTFKQVALVKKRKLDDTHQSEDVKRVLSNIF